MFFSDKSFDFNYDNVRIDLYNVQVNVLWSYFTYSVICLSVLQKTKSTVYFQYKCDMSSDNPHVMIIQILCYMYEIFILSPSSSGSSTSTLHVEGTCPWFYSSFGSVRLSRKHSLVDLSYLSTTFRGTKSSLFRLDGRSGTTRGPGGEVRPRPGPGFIPYLLSWDS